ncbi:hypothetical protein MSSIT_0289 [Methanosarcina siciliae T4/M]|uniref:DUF2953 domain-containing protein n=2 Tax=Methanosarcina siciliae TaxID=38027 RepID=A0A0E3PAB1_9EURY|nr:DUF2953 domain-containing protein [Methanosarcina siciliae]AKB27008.1 hypothetical protein MSSIT_0289 [Methanosarcina siciliae T4/M]AKB30973.1 hypothetical protein MSSIH_0283 [Methanosarcina siciliae HI350]
MFVIYLFLLVFLLVLFVLFTAIGLTFKLKVLSVDEKKELGGIFTVKWLLFSHTFSIKEPGEEKCFPEVPESEPGEAESERQTVVETGTPQGKRGSEQAESRKEDLLKAELNMQMEKDREDGGKAPEEETLIPGGKEKTGIEEKITLKEKTGGKEKRGLFARLRRKKGTGPKVEVEAKKGMSTREKLHWGLEAYKALRKPLFRLFSDTLSAIKIKNLKADLTFGLSDPADTGMLCGFIHALLGTVYSRCRDCSFSVCPVFMETLLDLRGSAEIRIKIYSLIFPFIKFIFNWKTLSFTYSIVKEKLRGSSKINS